MDIKELMKAIDGPNTKGMPKCSVVVINEFWYQDGNKDHVDEIVTESPIIRLFSGDGFTQVDLDFGSKHNMDLGVVYDTITKFREVENSIDDEGEKMPITTVVVLPEKYEGLYYLACINPMWVGLTANGPKEDLSVIRMTFAEESVLMYENEDFEFDEEDEKEEE